MSRPYDMSRDADASDKPPGWFPNMTAEISYVAVDYGLYDLRWWLPRYIVAEGVVKLGSFGALPMKYERTYDDYHVIGSAVAAAAPDTAWVRPCRPPMSMTVRMTTSTVSVVERDTAKVDEETRARLAAARARRDSIAAADSIRENRPHCTPREYTVTQRSDSVLLHSAELPESIYAGETLLSEGELDAIAERIEDIPEVPWLLSRPDFAFGPGGPGLLRYNRVEALSIGARARIDMGRISALGELRIATADAAVSAELGLQRETTTRSYHAGVYRRLSSVDPANEPFSISSSLGALLLCNDQSLLYRSTGAEFMLSPATARTQWYSLRMFAERQSAVRRNTNFSMRHLLDSDHIFPENIVADPADQVGGELLLRHDFGLNPAAPRAGIELRTRAEAGTYEFLQPALRLHTTFPLPLHLPVNLAFGGELAAGTSAGTVPTQSLWYVGGTNTLRGYEIGAMRGNAFWRGRGEIATRLPLARIALFSDVAGAGAREDWTDGRPLLSVGAGVSLLDGIVRLDLAHALREPGGWRLHMYTGGVF
jgi:hypothetical protein